MKQRSPDKYRDVVESILPDEAKKYAPLVLGRVKAHLGTISRDENCYHTVIGANALLKAWQNWQKKKEQYTEAQFLVLAKKYVYGSLKNDGDRDIASQKFSAWIKESLRQDEREAKEDEEREIQQAQARALRKEPVTAPEPPREDPYFSVFHYRVQLLPTREQAFMKWLHYTGSVADASKEMNLTRQAGNDIKRSAEKILEGYADRLASGETYSQLRREVDAKRKPGRYDAFLAPIVDEEGQAGYGELLEDEEEGYYEDWQREFMPGEAFYREEVLGHSSYDYGNG